MNNPLEFIAGKNSSASENNLAATLLADQLEVWVCAGLMHFWRTALPTDSGIYTLLQARIQLLLPVDTPVDWPSANEMWSQALQQQHYAEAHQRLPLVELIDDYQLSQAELFAIAFVGHIETSYLINLAVAELQSPDKAPRPCVHLVCALVDSLFADDGIQLNPWDISEQRWVQDQVVALHGDVPLPLKRLQIHPLLWSVLLGRQPSWPNTKRLHSESTLNKKAAADAVIFASLLRFRKNSGLVVRGNPNSGRGLFCSELALAMNLRAIEVPLEIWRDQPIFVLACRYAGWLPIIRPAVAPGDALRLLPKQQHQPVVLILGTDGAVDLGNMLEVWLEAPNQAEREELWQAALSATDCDDPQNLSAVLAASALLSADSIQMVAGHAKSLASSERQPLDLKHIAEARRKLGAEKLRLLAQPIFRQVNADALILPPLVAQGLDAVVLRARKREELWKNLGETLRVTPNSGVRALFVGESGTGKTLAASYIATRLAAPLYRVDLSAVMNKYIGESEKNLAQLLDHAAATDVVLLFDEADALFGSRNEGKENGERFANMLTNFLLTRIETHPGIVILTTNSRERIDTAFTRRLDAIVEFPTPGFEERLQLWRSHLGERGPGEEIYRSLASYCDLAGGQVRNVVLTAAAYADSHDITNANLLEGLRAEYRKQGREMPKKLENLSQ